MKTPLIRVSTAFLFISLLSVTSCRQKTDTGFEKHATDPEPLHTSVQRLNDIVIYEIFTPPVASRVFAYATLAHYEAIRWSDTSMPSLTRRLRGFPDMPKPEPGVVYDFRIAGVKALFDITSRLTFTKDSSRITEEAILSDLAKGVDRSVLERSVGFGLQVAEAVWKRASTDNYKEVQGMPRYTPSDLPGRWRNTPPDYLDAIQPHWSRMKPLVMDSSSQFKPVRPPSFDLAKGSDFMKEVMEVVDSTKNLSPEQMEIARFWDDNAAAVTHVGHMMYANKKPSPGGHWMNITAIACRQSKASAVPSSFAYAMTAIAMYEAFLSCWDVKYRSEYIRPVTVINEHVDKKWMPLLQTPPFPEYTSGHSVVSSTVATILTAIFGEDFAFTDDYEMPYIGIKRSFPSFMKASEEACVSRLYGGIHFRSAIENGKKQGRALGGMIRERLLDGK